MIDVNRTDKKLKKNFLIDINTFTVAYLEQTFKPVYAVIVNQSMGENNGIFPDQRMPRICMQLSPKYNILQNENLAWI